MECFACMCCWLICNMSELLSPLNPLTWSWSTWLLTGPLLLNLFMPRYKQGVPNTKWHRRIAALEVIMEEICGWILLFVVFVELPLILILVLSDH